MGKKKRTLVNIQDVREIGGDAGSYERFIDSNGGREDAIANPDLIAEQDNSPSTPQLLMGEAIQHLQGRQKEVYLSIMRDDKSMAETGELLGIGKSTVQTHLDRAIAFITQYCQAAMSKERI